MSKHTLNPKAAAWLTDTIARNRALYSGWRMEGEGEGRGGGSEAGAGEGGKESGKSGSEQTFTQADIDAAVDKIAAKIKADERRKVSEKYADYDDLKKAAEGKKSAEDRIAELEKSIGDANAKALRADIANQHGISTEDRDLFLTGTDEETLTTQAKRLAEREAERKKQGNHVTREGHSSSSRPDDKRAFARQLFGTGE